MRGSMEEHVCIRRCTTMGHEHSTSSIVLSLLEHHGEPCRTPRWGLTYGTSLADLPSSTTTHSSTRLLWHKPSSRPWESHRYNTWYRCSLSLSRMKWRRPLGTAIVVTKIGRFEAPGWGILILTWNTRYDKWRIAKPKHWDWTHPRHNYHLSAHEWESDVVVCLIALR